jgi:hypothetical protein
MAAAVVVLDDRQGNEHRLLLSALQQTVSQSVSSAVRTLALIFPLGNIQMLMLPVRTITQLWWGTVDTQQGQW